MYIKVNQSLKFQNQKQPEKLKRYYESEDKLKKYIKEENYKLNEIALNTNKVFNNNFDIKSKEYPIFQLNYHKKAVNCLLLLKDGRMASTSDDGSLIIYHKITYKPDLIIQEYDNIKCLTQLNSGTIAYCFDNIKIKLFNINGNNYKILQTLHYHTGTVCKIIELENKNLISCSFDGYLVVYSMENNEYKLNYKIKANNKCYSVIQTKNNEICYSDNYGFMNDDYDICFYDIFKRKKLETINGIRGRDLFMIRDNLLLIGGYKLSIIDVNVHNLIRIVNIVSWTNAFCLINENTLLTGDSSGAIIQYKIQDNNLILIYKKENAHNAHITSLLNLSNNQFASGSHDHTIKIW